MNTRISRWLCTLLVLIFCFGMWFNLSTAAADVKYTFSWGGKVQATLNTTNTTLHMSKKTLTLTATINTSIGNIRSISWESSNPAVATVSNKGVVTAKKCGTATITFTAKKTFGGSLTATCKVTVFDGTISTSASSLQMNLRDSSATKTLKCTINYTKQADTNVTWSSSNTAVATVSSNGVVTAIKPGTATITCRHNVYKTISTCKVTVVDKVVLDVIAREQTTGYCCAGAAAYAVIKYFNPSFSKTDMQLYNAMSKNKTIGDIANQINKYVANSPYCHVNSKDTLSRHQDAVVKSIRAGYPVVALVKINSKKYFQYTSGGHFTVIRGYEIAADGSVTFHIADSYQLKKNGGYFTIPAKEFFKYSQAHKHPYYLLVKK